MTNRTPDSLDCIGGFGCPAIYELTPKELRCLIGSCPAVYEKEASYLIVGRKVSQEKTRELGLEGKVGDGEALIEVPRALIDKSISGSNTQVGFGRGCIPSNISYRK